MTQKTIKSFESKFTSFKFIFAFIVITCTSIAAEAKTYYFSSSTGKDSYTTTQSQAQATPWASISKFNSFAASLVSGDIVLFKSGDVFYGTLTPKVSGVTFGAYGSGAKPIITGLTTISSWTSLGNNIWEAAVPGGLSTLNIVVMNGRLIPMGRYPNINTTNGGYLTYESSVINTSLTDNQLTSSTNWTGSEVVFRRQDFETDRAKITNHSGSTLTFTTYAGVSLTPGYGYFIQNSPATLDQNGEWYYDAATKKIKMYFTSTPPSIQVSTLANVISMVYTNTTIKSNITFRGLSFKGSEGLMMNLVYCNSLTVDNCDFSYAGINAIEYRYVNGFTIQNSNISDVNMIGIFENQSTLNNNLNIINNKISRIGINAGMINNSYGEGVSSTGINVGTGNLVIEQNTIDSTGYIAIALRGNKNNQAVRKNVISNFCAVKNDGGAIYNAGLRGSAIATNIVIENNIIFKAIGAIAGTTTLYNKHTRAIYLDATSYGIQVLNNTIFDAWDGIYISHAQNMTIKGNTVYNTGNYNTTLKYFSAAMVINDAFDGFQHVRNNTITDNIFFAKYPDQLLFDQTDKYSSSESIGTVDNNYYANPASDLPLLMTNTGTSFIQTPYSLDQWKAKGVYDRSSKGSPKKIPEFIVSSLIGKNKFPNEALTSTLTGILATSKGTVHSLVWDNTSQITGTGSAKLTSNVVSTNLTSLYSLVGGIDASKKYVLRFKTKGTKPGSFQAYIQQWSGSYAIVSSRQTGAIGTGVEQHEVVFSGDHTTESTAALFINFSQDNSTVYVDDLQLFEATTADVNVDDYLRFEYNPTNSPVTIPLSNVYTGVDGAIYNTGSITIPAYGSKILFKDMASGTIEAPPVVGTRPTVSVTAGAVNCTGTSTAVTVSAAGGNAPYTGTGVFNTNAGKGSLKITFPSSVASSSTAFSAPIGAITAGKNYVLKFTTLGTTPNGRLNAHLRQYASPFKQLTSLQNNNFGTSRVDHSFFFTPNASDANGMFMIDIFQNSGTTYIDNVAFFEADGTGKLIGANLFSNSQFESNITGLGIWSANNNQVATWDNTAKINNTNYYTVTDAMGAKSTVGLTIKQAAAPLNAVVTLSGLTSLTVSVTGGSGPYTGLGTFIGIAGLNSFTVKDANGCTDVASINISLTGARVANGGGSSLNMSLDTAQVTSAPLKITSYPNPTVTDFGLLVEGGSNEKVLITVIGVDGRTVYQTNGTTNKNYRFGSNFTPGLYIIKVIQGNTLQTLKVIKSS
ncbi:MAG: T9SS type A sorting domain-containing protein [Ferruginibacter sp.]